MLNSMTSLGGFVKFVYKYWNSGLFVEISIGNWNSGLFVEIIYHHNCLLKLSIIITPARTSPISEAIHFTLFLLSNNRNIINLKFISKTPTRKIYQKN